MGAILSILVYELRFIAIPPHVNSVANLQTVEAPNTGEPLLSAEARLPSCPAAGVPILKPSQHTGHHKVTLTWNASSPSPHHEGKAVGYCLYRSTKQNAARKDPICRDCEQINLVAIVGTGCVDDLVLDGAAYYYVVTAIAADGQISSSSNETPARIPSGKEPARSAPAGSYPLCRMKVGTQ